MATLNDPIRILQINSGNRNFGGVSSFLFNVYNNIDREKVQFDFLSPNITTYEIHRKEIEEMGGRIYEMGASGNPILSKVKLYKRLKSFLREHTYLIVHINSGNFFFNLIVSAVSRRSGVRCIIVHSHNTEDPNSSALKKKAVCLLRGKLEQQAHILCACSNAAAEFMFRKETISDGKVIIVRNGIDTGKFAFNERIRQQMREQLGLEDRFVVGHVGRFNAQKNHEFLIRVFNVVLQKNRNAVLLLFGTGVDEDKIRNKVRELNLTNAVRFMGTKDDIENYYQAMDVFVLPSVYEGFGIVNIEAQCSGLPCIVSTEVPDDVKVSGLVKKVSLKRTESKWAEIILRSGVTVRKDYSEQVKQSGYDAKMVSEGLQELYLRAFEEYGNAE